MEVLKHGPDVTHAVCTLPTQFDSWLACGIKTSLSTDHGIDFPGQMVMPRDKTVPPKTDIRTAFVFIELTIAMGFEKGLTL